MGTHASFHRPNILVVLTDDHHHGAFGAAGNREVRTPAMDRLAREGARLTGCHVSSPVSTVSRAALLTGQFGFRNGCVTSGHPIAQNAPRVAELLSRYGYCTALVGKWHNDQRPVHHGFDHMRNVFCGGMHDYSSIPVVQHAEDRPRELRGNPTEIFTDGALGLLKGTLQEPYALFVCYTAPHDPRTPPPAYEAMFPPESVSLPPNFRAEPTFDPGILANRDETLLPRPLDPGAIKRECGRYYGLISHMDSQLALLVEHLEDQGQLDRTAVFVTAGTGLCLGAHGLLGKQVMYDDAVKVPLIVRGPGIRPGLTSHALVHLMDLMPTMCDVAGIQIPSSVQGRTLTPIMAGRRRAHRSAVFGYYRDLFRMVRTGHHKLIHHLKTGRHELFDLEADPHEMNDLSESGTHAPVLTALRAELDRWRREMKDPTLAAKQETGEAPEG